jgi:hypothetical protein
MFKVIEGLPQDVLAIEAIGEVTHEDYYNTLISTAEAMIAKGPIKMLYILGKTFTGFKLDALWGDGAFGLKHWRDFTKIAVVSDHARLRAIVSMFKPFFRGELRLLRLRASPASSNFRRIRARSSVLERPGR